MKKTLLLLLISFSIILFSCSKEKLTEPVKPIDPEADYVTHTDGDGEVGDGGGYVESSNSYSYGAFVDIPAGAMDGIKNIQIIEVDEEEKAPTDENAIVVQYLPEGAVFQRNVKIGLPYKSGQNVSELKMFYYDIDKGIVEQFPIDSIDYEKKIVVTSTNHFSKYNY
ncbi:MAG: hypothetical protein L3J08_07260 [Flavobacteriaceae bacterium]|nr:hypothetical protein [Flavobacteriaceae bacterium]